MRRKTRRFLALALVCGMLFASSCGKNVEKEILFADIKVDRMPIGIVKMNGA